MHKSKLIETRAKLLQFPCQGVDNKVAVWFRESSLKNELFHMNFDLDLFYFLEQLLIWLFLLLLMLVHTLNNFWPILFFYTPRMTRKPKIYSCFRRSTSIHSELVNPWLWNFAWVWYYIRSFKKYQNSNQGNVNFFIKSSYFKTVFEVKYFCE